MKMSPQITALRPRFRPGLSIVHRLITNWLLTDPSYIVASEGTTLKNYQVQKYPDMRVWYLCGGRLRTVKQVPLNVCVAALLIVVSGVLYFVYEASWTWHHTSPAVVILFTYLWFLSACFFFKAATVDPGIQPRNIHIPYDITSTSTHANGPDEYFNTIYLPYYSDKTHGVCVKYCATCHIWRTPRMSHCAVCNSCILNHDHHCVFLNNCVGHRNYRYFLWFILVSFVLCVYLSAFSFLHCFYYRLHIVTHNGTPVSSFKGSITHSPVAFYLALLGCIGGIYPFILLVFHIYLTANNLTTREYLNYVRPLADSDEKYVNVFDKKNWFKNMWLAWIATPQCESFLHPTDTYVEGDFSKEALPVLLSFHS